MKLRRRRRRQRWAAGPSRPTGWRVSPESAVGAAAAAPARTSAAGAPGRSASPPRAASPGSVTLTARGLEAAEEGPPHGGRGREGEEERLELELMTVYVTDGTACVLSLTTFNDMSHMMERGEGASFLPW